MIDTKQDVSLSARRMRIDALLRGPFDVRSLALTGLFLMASVYMIYFAKPVLLPIVLAVLLSYLLVPFVRILGKIGISPFLGAAMVILAALSLMGLGISRLAAPAAGWLEIAPYSLQKVQEKIRPLKKPVEKVTQAGAEIANLTGPGEGKEKKQTVEVKESHLPGFITQTPDFLLSLATVVILLYFLLAHDGLFLRKLIKVTPRLADKKRAVEIARQIERNISTYLVTITFINAGLGCFVATSLYFLGMPNPVLWGTMACVLNFVPYLGALTGIVSLALAAVLSFDNLTWAAVFPASYFAIAVLEGNFITPMILGRSFSLNPVVIFVSLMFWGWLWGIGGALLAVPILAVLKIFCDHIEPLGPVGELLSE